MIDDEYRRRILVSHEAGTIGLASQASNDDAIAIARAQVDGIMNGLVRLAGADRPDGDVGVPQPVARRVLVMGGGAPS